MIEKALEKKYNYWSWRTVISLMFGYALYYFVRKNFSVAIPAMESELGMSKEVLGIYLTLNGVVYGVSRFINGVISDRFSKKWLMAIGLALSALVNFGICFSPQMSAFMEIQDGTGKATTAFVFVVGGLWVVNGYLQGMGVPPCQSLMANWIRPSQLSTRQSVWNASHSIGAGVVAFLCGVLLKNFGYSAWNLCFAIPAAISLIGVPIILIGCKDEPSSVGIPPVEKLDEMDALVGVTPEPVEEKMSGAQYKKVLSRMVFKNPFIWTLAIANFCIYVIRLTILDWGSSFLTQSKGFDIDLAGSIVAASEIVGGILGMLLAGWMTDKFFHSKAHWTCLFCTVGATLCFLGFWLFPNKWVSIILLIMSAFFIYGPQALLGVCASMQATKKAAATANGILGFVGYLSPLISGFVFGLLADTTAESGLPVFGWDLVFLISVIFGILGCVTLAFMWKAPADGYKRLETVMASEK